MKRSFLEVRAGSRELENDKNQIQTQANTQTKHLPFELMKRPFQTNLNHILLKLMKRSFLEVRAGSKELENEKNQIQTQNQNHTKPIPKPKHLPFEIYKKNISNQI